MNLYLLYYDTNLGEREEWNTFYTPCEVFDDPAKRQARIKFLETAITEDDEPYTFHTVDTVLMTDEMMTKIPSNGLDDDFENS